MAADSNNISPQITYALIVGIETYIFQYGDDINTIILDNLDGPARAAIMFAEWIIGRNVPPGNIYLFVSFLDKNKNFLNSLNDKGVLVRDAKFEDIKETIQEKLCDNNFGDLLYFFWSGHGFITIDEESGVKRRLPFCNSEKNYYYNIDLDLLRFKLKFSPRNSGFSRQIYFIDTCANQLGNIDSKKWDDDRLTCYQETQKKKHKQFVLFATPESMAAITDSKKGITFFSEAVMEALNDGEVVAKDSLLPDMTKLTKQVRQKLQSCKKPEPSYIRDWDDDEDLQLATKYIGSQISDWGDSPDFTNFFGRTEELNMLEKWIVNDHCRLVTLVGMGGIGKTTLAKKLAEKIRCEFDYLIWRSLRDPRPIQEILSDLIKILSDQQKNDLPKNLPEAITLLIKDYLQPSRCLLILDNVESIMQSGDCAGEYKEGYEGYRELFDAIGESSHDSCLLLTSREKPQNIERLVGEDKPVRFSELPGLTYEDGLKIFTNNSLSGTERELKEVFHLYGGNPLFLDLAAKHIKASFNSNIYNFLKGAKFVIGQPLSNFKNELESQDAIRKMLDWYFQRLSDDKQSDEEQKEIMYWLAINRQPVSISELEEDILLSTAKKKYQTRCNLYKDEYH